jgi:hypothetical protein
MRSGPDAQNERKKTTTTSSKTHVVTLNSPLFIWILPSIKNKLFIPRLPFEAALRYIHGYITVKSFLKNAADTLPPSDPSERLRYEEHDLIT